MRPLQAVEGLPSSDFAGSPSRRRSVLKPGGLIQRDRCGRHPRLRIPQRRQHRRCGWVSRCWGGSPGGDDRFGALDVAPALDDKSVGAQEAEWLATLIETAGICLSRLRLSHHRCCARAHVAMAGIATRSWPMCGKPRCFTCACAGSGSGPLRPRTSLPPGDSGQGFSRRSGSAPPGRRKSLPVAAPGQVRRPPYPVACPRPYVGDPGQAGTVRSAQGS